MFCNWKTVGSGLCNWNRSFNEPASRWDEFQYLHVKSLFILSLWSSRTLLFLGEQNRSAVLVRMAWWCWSMVAHLRTWGLDFWRAGLDEEADDEWEWSCDWGGWEMVPGGCWCKQGGYLWEALVMEEWLAAMVLCYGSAFFTTIWSVTFGLAGSRPDHCEPINATSRVRQVDIAFLPSRVLFPPCMSSCPRDTPPYRQTREDRQCSQVDHEGCFVLAMFHAAWFRARGIPIDSPRGLVPIR